MDYHTEKLSVIKTDPNDTEFVYDTPIEEFRISRLRLEESVTKKFATSGRPSILLVIEGNIEIKWKDELHGEVMPLSKGCSVFIPAILPEFEIVPKGPAVIFKTDAY